MDFSFSFGSGVVSGVVGTAGLFVAIVALILQERRENAKQPRVSVAAHPVTMQSTCAGHCNTPPSGLSLTLKGTSNIQTAGISINVASDRSIGDCKVHPKDAAVKVTPSGTSRRIEFELAFNAIATVYVPVIGSATSPDAAATWTLTPAFDKPCNIDFTTVDEQAIQWNVRSGAGLRGRIARFLP